MNKAMSTRLLKARSYLDQNVECPLRLDELSRIASLSKFEFESAFSRAFGSTPHQYLLNRRLSKARDLLECGIESIQDVCQKSGFESTCQFQSYFRRRWGISPERFRAALKK